MDNLGCTGTESSLAECIHNGWGIHDCDHGDDVSIKCAVPTTTQIGRCSSRSYTIDCPVSNWNLVIFQQYKLCNNEQLFLRFTAAMHKPIS